MSNQKVIFLDIDGTLTDFGGKIPESAKKALTLAKQAGHRLVVCTGRSRYQISEEIRSLPFDGMIGGAGAFVIADGKELFHHYIKPEPRKRLISYLEENKFFYTVQTDVGTLINNRCHEQAERVYREIMKLTEKQRADLEGKLMVREDIVNYEKSEKVVYQMAPFTVAQVQKDLAPDFSVTDMSFKQTERNSGEIGIAGINKATGMQAYLSHVGQTKEDAIAFGDSANDMEMIDFAACGVAMGNAIEVLKARADMVADAVDEDGIYKAFLKLQLI